MDETIMESNSPKEVEKIDSIIIGAIKNRSALGVNKVYRFFTFSKIYLCILLSKVNILYNFKAIKSSEYVCYVEYFLSGMLWGWQPFFVILSHPLCHPEPSR
jgi:hypothetical protein